MLKMLCAYTYELDDPSKAVQDILDQLDIPNKLLKNSAAMLFCHSKFIEMGIMEAVCSILPFDVIGCTSMYFAMSAPAGTSAPAGEIMLTVTVLTGDEIEFAVGASEPLTGENAADTIQALYHNTASSLGGRPDMVFAAPPVLLNLPIDMMIAALDSACESLPVFGTVALDMDSHIRIPQTIYQGAGKAAAYRDRMMLLLLKGPVRPRFLSVRFPEHSILTQDAVITKADGPQLISINHEPAAVFLRKTGILYSDSGDFTHAIPLIIENSKGKEPDVVIMHDINKEGVLICSKNIPVGGILNIGAITRDHVLKSTAVLIGDIAKNETRTGLIIFSCFLRSIILGGSAAAEVELIQRELVNLAVPYLFLNSGGELCPKNTVSGGTVNQVLQYALVACQF